MTELELMNIIEDCCPELENEDFCQDTSYEYVDRYLLKQDPKLAFYSATGASKYVITLPDVNWVLKIPFYGTMLEEYNEETDEYEWVYSEFDNAVMGEDWTGSDYCSAEVYYWQQAAQYGLAKCFAKTEYIGTIRNTPIYRQEKAMIYDEIYHHEYEEDFLEYIADLCSSVDGYCFSRTWLADFYIYYGEEKLFTLMRFLQTYHINDLHSGNYGYIKGRPVLTDYSDFQS